MVMLGDVPCFDEGQPGQRFTLLPWNMVLIPWANDLIHFIGPLLVIGDWIIDQPKPRLRFRPTLYWFVLPAAYAVYSVVRSNITGWYPYPFLDNRTSGYGLVVIACAGLGGLVLVLSAAVVWLSGVPVHVRQRQVMQSKRGTTGH